MKLERIKEFLGKCPFQPFALIMDNEQRALVPHPDYLFISPTNSDTIIVAKAQGGFNVVDLEHISNLEINASVKKSKSKRSSTR